MGIFSWLEDKVKSAEDTISHAIGTVYNDIKSGISSVGHAVGNVYSDAKSAASKVYTAGTNLVTKVENDTIGSKGIVQTGLGDAKSIVSTPLILIAGGLGLGLIFLSRNSSVSASVSR